MEFRRQQMFSSTLQYLRQLNWSRVWATANVLVLRDSAMLVLSLEPCVKPWTCETACCVKQLRLNYGHEHCIGTWTTSNPEKKGGKQNTGGRGQKSAQRRLWVRVYELEAMAPSQHRTSRETRRHRPPDLSLSGPYRILMWNMSSNLFTP